MFTTDSRKLLGRQTIYTAYDEINRDNLLDALNTSISIHNSNSGDIDYLWKYMRGDQPIWSRTKDIREEINNKIVENHAYEIVTFLSGYLMGEPCTYVNKGKRAEAISEIDRINDYMFEVNKAGQDKTLSMWLYICGVGYRMVLPDKNLGKYGETPFQIDVLDPRYTFLVYKNDFGKERMMGVRVIGRMINDKLTPIYCGYTKTHYFECTDSQILTYEPHSLGDIPIFEYRANMAMLGSFEPVIPMLDAINTIASNRVDGIEQFVQSFIKFINCDVDEETFKELKKMGAIKIKSTDGLNADVDIISQELNQMQTQTLVEYLYQMVLTICGLPTTNRSQGGSSDNGVAVILRQGWEQCEARARDTELLFKQSEKDFLRLVLDITNRSLAEDKIPLRISELDIKFTRRQHDNLLTKAQALLNMLEAGLKPEIAIATCGLFNDPMDIALQSKEYLDNKWLTKKEEVEKPVVNPQEEVVDNE